MTGKENIIELISEDGNGKTYSVMGFPEEICILDVDGKAHKTYNAFYSDKLITIKTCNKYHVKSDVSRGILRGNLDVDATLASIYSNVSDILDNMESYEVITIDGISDLKRIVSKWWLLHDKKGRKAIGDNIAARAEINTIVKEKMLFPLINLARELDKTLIYTSKMTDDYIPVEGEDGKIHNVKSGTKVADSADWIAYGVDIKITLNRDKAGKYWLYWHRAPGKDLPVREEITNKSLYQVMMDRGVLV